MYPPPRTIRCSGISVSDITFSFVRYGPSSIPGDGGIRGRIPVAMNTRSARSTRSPTRTSFGERNRAAPSARSSPGAVRAALRDTARSPTIIESISPTIVVRSTRGSPAWMPKRPAVRVTCATRARWIKNLLGTQPTFKQVLPQGCRKTRATRAPAPAARFATMAPASPAPRTIASNSLRWFMESELRRPNARHDESLVVLAPRFERPKPHPLDPLAFRLSVLVHERAGALQRRVTSAGESGLSGPQRGSGSRAAESRTKGDQDEDPSMTVVCHRRCARDRRLGGVRTRGLRRREREFHLRRTARAGGRRRAA